MSKKNLESNPIHLGLGALAKSQPKFTGIEWYESYAQRTLDDGREGRLISMHRFEKSWGVWEMHPKGDEVVICTEGEMTLVQVVRGTKKRIRLRAGEYAINPAGVWHTAEVRKPATGIFITAGLGTENRQKLPKGVLKPI